MGSLRIRKVEALEEYRLRLTLTDDSVIERDVSDLLDGPIFELLRENPTVFAQARPGLGTVVWPNGADIDPDTLIWDGPPPREPGAKPKPTLRNSVPAS
ncbi:MAG: DUF2442 domain-containing protein [bacterium]